jgi:hypothetical protein
MAAPTPTTRVAPSGRKIPDGQGIFITFASNPDLLFWEKSAKPPGYDGGDAIDITDSFNVRKKTKAPRTLVDSTDMEVTGFWEPGSLVEIEALLNVEDVITVTYPDGSKDYFYGFARVWESEDVAEGEPVMGTLTITESDWDHVNRGEANHATTSVAGT